jgi:hypothetical protein
MRTLWIFGSLALGIVAGGTVGGLSGWAVGDFGGRSDPENVWFLALIGGAAVGLAIALAFLLRYIRGIGWGSSLLLGTLSGVAAGAAVVTLVAWHGHP